LGAVREKALEILFDLARQKGRGLPDALGLNVCDHHNYASICIYLHKCHCLKTKLLSPLPWERGRGWTVPPAIPGCLADGEAILYPLSPLPPSPVPLAQRSIWAAAASLHPSSYLLPSPPAACHLLLVPGFSVPALPTRGRAIGIPQRSRASRFLRTGAAPRSLPGKVGMLDPKHLVCGYRLQSWAGGGLSVPVCTAPGKRGLSQGVQWEL